MLSSILWNRCGLKYFVGLQLKVDEYLSDHVAWLLVKPSRESFSICLQRVASSSLLKFGVARSGVESVYFQPALPGACGTDGAQHTRLASEQRGLW